MPPKSPKGASSSKKGEISPKKGAPASPKKGAVLAPVAKPVAGPVAPSKIQAEVGKITAYRADEKQPVPAPKQFMIIATFVPTFITAQNKGEVTSTISSQQMQTVTYAPSEQLQTVTYAPSPLPPTTITPSVLFTTTSAPQGLPTTTAPL